jgi:hypothetical protein
VLLDYALPNAIREQVQWMRHRVMYAASLSLEEVTIPHIFSASDYTFVSTLLSKAFPRLAESAMNLCHREPVYETASDLPMEPNVMMLMPFMSLGYFMQMTLVYLVMIFWMVAVMYTLYKSGRFVVFFVPVVVFLYWFLLVILIIWLVKKRKSNKVGSAPIKKRSIPPIGNGDDEEYDDDEDDEEEDDEEEEDEETAEQMDEFMPWDAPDSEDPVGLKIRNIANAKIAAMQFKAKKGGLQTQSQQLITSDSNDENANDKERGENNKKEQMIKPKPSPPGRALARLKSVSARANNTSKLLQSWMDPFGDHGSEEEDEEEEEEEEEVATEELRREEPLKKIKLSLTGSSSSFGSVVKAPRPAKAAPASAPALTSKNMKGESMRQMTQIKNIFAKKKKRGLASEQIIQFFDHDSDDKNHEEEEDIESGSGSDGSEPLRFESRKSVRSATATKKHPSPNVKRKDSSDDDDDDEGEFESKRPSSITTKSPFKSPTTPLRSPQKQSPVSSSSSSINNRSQRKPEGASSSDSDSDGAKEKGEGEGKGKKASPPSKTTTPFSAKKSPVAAAVVKSPSKQKQSTPPQKASESDDSGDNDDDDDDDDDVNSFGIDISLFD